MDILLVVLIVVLIGVVVWALLRSSRTPISVSSPSDVDDMRSRLEAHDYAIEALGETMRQTRTAVAEGIDRVERTENRIKSTIRRAQEKLADAGYESPGLEAEAAQLHLIDGDGGPGSELPAVPTDVEEAASSIPGVTAADLKRARGL